MRWDIGMMAKPALRSFVACRLRNARAVNNRKVEKMERRNVMDTKITITEQAPAERSTELSEKTLSQITGGIYMNFSGEDIKGSVTANGYENWIELLSCCL